MWSDEGSITACVTHIGHFATTHNVSVDIGCLVLTISSSWEGTGAAKAAVARSVVKITGLIFTGVRTGSKEGLDVDEVDVEREKTRKEQKAVSLRPLASSYVVLARGCEYTSIQWIMNYHLIVNDHRSPLSQIVVCKTLENTPTLPSLVLPCLEQSRVTTFRFLWIRTNLLGLIRILVVFLQPSRDSFYTDFPTPTNSAN